MAITTTLKPESLEQDIRAVLFEFLSDYFDGAAHPIGSLSVTFVNCEIMAAWRPPAGQPLPKPVIGFGEASTEQVDNSAFDNESGANRTYSQKHLVKVEIYIYVSNDTTKPGEAKKTLDQISSQISLLMNSRSHELGQALLRKGRIGSGVPIVLERYASQHRSFRGEALIRYERW